MLLTFVGCFALPSLAAQVPLGLPPHGQPSLELGSASTIRPYDSASPLNSDSLDLSPWQLDEPPPANATGHFVFETVNSLLQHWPNTRYRNGHAMVPGVIPKGTLLYHGAVSDKIPTVPEWTATDPEHSILFCEGPPETGCWHLTLAATRPLKVLYFDGTSAANTINVIAWGELRPDWRFKEDQRIEDLCKWGAPYAVDGYVRIELFLQNGNGLSCSVILRLAWKSSPGLTLPALSSRRLQSQEYQILLAMLPMFEVMHAGSWHNRYPGDTRINLNLAGIVSLYDTTLVPSLVGSRHGQERCDHGVGAISSADIEGGQAQGLSHIRARSRVIVERYSERLDLMDYLLNSENDTPVDRAMKVHVQLRVMLTPYIFYTTVPPSASHDSSNSWATPVFKACGTAHTSSIASYISSLNPSERLLLHAAQETSREICRVITNMWVSGVLAGLDIYLPRNPTPATQMVHLIDTWRQELSALMTWLDWSVWVRCRPVCGPEEMCYLPSWPINVPRRRGRPGRPPYRKYENSDNTNASLPDRLFLEDELLMQLASPQDDDWRKPQPKCIRRVAPYGF
ncbi:hypothetical protein EDB19DRAFT_1952044 [Suillus lakei]|nr:hypothetical protein EDB19DRAFT_1952044 [Suillus lakei]